MGKKMTEKEWAARAQAYLEAADHLECAWCTDAVEREQGMVVASRLRRKADRCFARADSLQTEQTNGEL